MFVFTCLLLSYSEMNDLTPHKSDPRFVDHALKLNDYKTVHQLLTVAAKADAPVSDTPSQPGYLGVMTEWVNQRVKVTMVQQGSPAEEFGFKAGDIVQNVGGKKPLQEEHFSEWLRARKEGDLVEVLVERQGTLFQLNPRLSSISRPLSNVLPPVIGVAAVNLEGEVKIDRVLPDSVAEKAGLKNGDIILSIGAMKITDRDQLSAAIYTQKVSDSVSMLVRRGTNELKYHLRLPDNSGTGRRGDFGMGTGDFKDREGRLFKQQVYRVAVIPVEFSDEKHYVGRSPADWDRMLFSRGTYFGIGPHNKPVYGSLNDYYLNQSFGKLSVDGHTFDWVTVARKRADYANDRNRFALLGEATDKLMERHGRNALDGYNGIFFIYAGDRYPTNRGGLYWPHRSTFSYNGKRLDYFICPEGGANFTNISVIAHEFGHLLGLKDYYARPESPGSEGLGIWCTMATGHGGEGRPFHYSVFCKERMGWMKPVTIDPRVKQKVLLRPVTTGENECIKVLAREDGSEYFLLENRIQRGWDESLPGSGLLIWRIVDRQPVLEESHGIAGPDGPGRWLSSVPFPSVSNNSFTPYTTPSSRAQKGGGLPVHITNIQKLPNGDVTFWIGYEFN